MKVLKQIFIVVLFVFSLLLITINSGFCYSYPTNINSNFGFSYTSSNQLIGVSIEYPYIAWVEATSFFDMGPGIPPMPLTSNLYLYNYSNPSSGPQLIKTGLMGTPCVGIENGKVVWGEQSWGPSPYAGISMYDINNPSAGVVELLNDTNPSWIGGGDCTDMYGNRVASWNVLYDLVEGGGNPYLTNGVDYSPSIEGCPSIYGSNLSTFMINNYPGPGPYTGMIKLFDLNAINGGSGVGTDIAYVTTGYNWLNCATLEGNSIYYIDYDNVNSNYGIWSYDINTGYKNLEIANIGDNAAINMRAVWQDPMFGDKKIVYLTGQGPFNPVPEPATLLLLGSFSSGLIGFSWIRRSRGNS